jgi:hypothetical protein
MSFVVSSEGADARLKSEWKFGGSLARTIMALPVASAVFGERPASDYSMRTAAVQPAGGSLGELFSRRGVVGGFAAGFLGAGVFGILFGHGVYGELSSAASVLGLTLQLALFLMLGRLIWTWWRADPAGFADLSPRQLADAYGRPRHEALPEIDSSPGADITLVEFNSESFKPRDEAGR